MIASAIKSLTVSFMPAIFMADARRVVTSVPSEEESSCGGGPSVRVVSSLVTDGALAM